ncbi:SRPBCC family protein [Microcella humidisoli]|uniref:SRPBCC family protein n=1 Tax=Microcella humidisoli TaxID=2963406 RepID=A0ABY5FXB5_9MICO|nr:SRPBCC family protein [Microcella humidisoli]UTT62956.1 SRPBCC family protein [Microcella humidisoli]
MPNQLLLRERVARTVAEVMAVAADVRRLPEWAAGFASGIQRDESVADGSAWIVDAPFGRVRAVFAVDVERGILDHDVTMPDGSTVHNRLRVEPAPNGCELVFTLVRQPGMDDAALAADAAAVADDLRRLRALCERMDA